jgi:uncharacterized protein involved in exopolysaccharide biosynthesis
MDSDKSTRGAGASFSSYDGEEAFNEPRMATLGHWVQFVVSAALRRKLLVAALLLGGFASLAAYYSTKTPLYRVTTTLLAQRQQSVPSIVRASLPNDAPTRSAYELIHRRENLVSLLKQADLYKLPDPKATSSGGSWLRSALARLGSDPTPPEDPLNAVVLRLKKSLYVETGEGTVSITVDWPDAQQAYQLVAAALQNFLEARQLQEITAIDDAITLLQGRVSILRDELDTAIGRSLPRTVQSAEGNPPPSGPDSSSRTARPPSDALALLKATLDAKERAIRDVDDFRRRRLLDLQSQLDEKRGVYSEAHPNVVALRTEVEALSRESPQIAALQEEVNTLRAEYDERSGIESRQSTTPSRSDRRSRQVVVAPGAETEQVRDARFRYQQMLERVNAAQLDLDSARAAFKYRYTVVWPAEVPRKPVSPNPLVTFGIGGLMVLILAPTVAAWIEHRQGKVLTRSQVETGLGLPVLAEFNRGN